MASSTRRSNFRNKFAGKGTRLWRFLEDTKIGNFIAGVVVWGLLIGIGLYLFSIDKY